MMIRSFSPSAGPRSGHHPQPIRCEAGVLALALLASLVTAQLPTGHMAVAAYAGGGLPGAILHLDPATGYWTTVSGSCPQDVNSLLYDPATGDYFVGGRGVGPSPAPGQILRLSLQGDTITASAHYAQLPSPYVRVAAMTMDENGNVIVAAEGASGSEVLRIDRISGVVEPLTATPFAMSINALTGKDFLYVALTGASSAQPSEIRRLRPDGTTELIATTAGVVSGNQFVTGLALGPDRDELWVSCFGYPSLFKILLDTNPGIPPQLVPLPLVSAPLNDVRYDEGTQRFFFCSRLAAGNEVWSVDPSGSYAGLQSALGPLQGVGITSQMQVGARPGELTVFPCAVAVTQPTHIPIEVTLHGLPGERGFVYASALQFGAPPVFVPLATPLFMGPLQPCSLSMPPFSLTVDGSSTDIAFHVGCARFDSYTSLIGYEPLAGVLALRPKEENVVKMDGDPATDEPDIVNFGTYAVPKSLKVHNCGPATVYLMERSLPVPPGTWRRHSVIQAGQEATAAPGANAPKEFRVEIVGGPRAKATFTWN